MRRRTAGRWRPCRSSAASTRWTTTRPRWSSTASASSPTRTLPVRARNDGWTGQVEALRPTGGADRAPPSCCTAADGTWPMSAEKVCRYLARQLFQVNAKVGGRVHQSTRVVRCAHVAGPTRVLPCDSGACLSFRSRGTSWCRTDSSPSSSGFAYVQLAHRDGAYGAGSSPSTASAWLLARAGRRAAGERRRRAADGGLLPGRCAVKRPGAAVCGAVCAPGQVDAGRPAAVPAVRPSLLCRFADRGMSTDPSEPGWNDGTAAGTWPLTASSWTRCS